MICLQALIILTQQFVIIPKLNNHFLVVRVLVVFQPLHQLRNFIFQMPKIIFEGGVDYGFVGATWREHGRGLSAFYRFLVVWGFSWTLSNGGCECRCGVVGAGVVLVVRRL
jgi:hypothetical protein